jgi:hypothetical protein
MTVATIARQIAERAEVLGKILSTTQDNAQRLDRADLVARIERERAAMTARPCRVLVIGEFNQGKSSLVNALLNGRVCATDPTAITAIPTIVCYGTELSATALIADDGSGHDSTELIPLSRVAALTTAGPLAVEQTERRYRAMRVTAPRQLLHDGIELVDTPGVGGGMASARAATTLRALAGADVVVFVSDASAELTRSELDFMKQAADLCPSFVCALTKIDFYPAWREVLAANRAHLRRNDLDLEIVPLSAPARIRGLAASDPRLVAESGYPQLVERLRAGLALTSSTGQASAAAVAQTSLIQLIAQLTSRRESLKGGQPADEERQKWEAASRRAARLVGGQGWHRALADGIRTLSAEVEFDLSNRFRDVTKEARNKIADEDPTRDWVVFGRWLHQRTNEELMAHVRVIRRQADDVADLVAREFGVAAWELRVSVDVVDFSQGGKGAELAAVSDRSSRLQLGMLAARGGSTGVIFTHAVGLIIGLGTMTLPITTVVATALAGTSWRAGHTSQLKGVRVEAERAVSAFLNEAELIARKNSRDSVMHVERQLRNVFSRRADELLKTANANAEATEHRVSETEASRASEERTISKQLDDLRALEERAGQLVNDLLAGA